MTVQLANGLVAAALTQIAPAAFWRFLIAEPCYLSNQAEIMSSGANPRECGVVSAALEMEEL